MSDVRLIDANALLKGKDDHEMISTHLIWNAPSLNGYYIARDEVCEMIKNDAEELKAELEDYIVKAFKKYDLVSVTRCKDCRWAYPRKLKGETGVHCVFYRADKASEGYCEIGEKRDGG